MLNLPKYKIISICANCKFGEKKQKISENPLIEFT